MLTVVDRIGEKAATFGTSGNASARDPMNPDRFWITPSGLPWPDIQANHLVAMTIPGGQAAKGHLRPSSEWRLHLALYQHHPFVGGIVHLHSPYATILSTLHEPIRAVHYQMARVGDQVPVVPYFTFGSQELADAVSKAIHEQQRGLLLANHGLVAVGETIAEAWRAAEEMEWTAMIQYQASLLGKPHVLTSGQLDAVRRAFSDYGQRAD
nr:class II aldolase/adducin family protein [Sulfobacillus harzensis]